MKTARSNHAEIKRKPFARQHCQAGPRFLSTQAQQGRQEVSSATDAYLDELTRQVMNVTGLSRLSNVEARLVVDTVLSLHGQPLERPRLAPIVKARTIEGQPIYADDADHSPTETVTMR